MLIRLWINITSSIPVNWNAKILFRKRRVIAWLGFIARTFTQQQLYPETSAEILHTSVRQIKDIFHKLTFPSQIYYDSTPRPTTLVCKRCREPIFGLSFNGYCPTCTRCNGYQNLSRANHTTTCSSLPKLITDIGAIYDKVVGLDLEDFGRANKEGAKDGSMPQAERHHA